MCRLFSRLLCRFVCSFNCLDFPQNQGSGSGSGLLTVLYLPPPFLARLNFLTKDKACLDANLLFDIGLGGLAFTATGSLTAQSEGRGERREAQLSSLSSGGLLEEQRPNFHHQPAQNQLNKIQVQQPGTSLTFISSQWQNVIMLNLFTVGL